MNIEWLGGVPSSNFMVGREGNPVALIVDHWSVISFEDTVAAFQRNGVVKSSHFVISSDGRIVQLVSTDDTAYHAGVWNVNLRALGIEHEASPTLPPTDALYAASAWLHRELARIYQFPLEVGTTVEPHRKFIPTACPGTLDLDHIVALANLKEEELAFANDPDAQAFKNDINDSVTAIKEDLKALHAAIAAFGSVSVAPPKTLAEVAASAPAPAGYHWVGTRLVANA